MIVKERGGGRRRKKEEEVKQEEGERDGGRVVKIGGEGVKGGA